jgi:RNA polymerase sigma-70 factor, ECF subfamily
MWENPHEEPMSTQAERPRIARTDRELATLATAGDGDAFAELYDRHERRVYGFCLRVLTNADDAADATQETFMRLLARLPALEGRDVNPIAYALTTARNVCYDAIAARRRTEPAEEIELGAREPGDIVEDPERAALLQGTREQVRAANARLSERQREVLALRELEGMSYEQIGEIVGLNANAVAQLISRARIRLRDLLRGDALESIAAATPDCERALPLLARSQDAQRAGAAEMEWLHGHMAECETCRLSQAAMQEAGTSYRALGPIVPLVWLRHTTIARAAELVGADWSHLTMPGHGQAAGHGHGTALGGGVPKTSVSRRGANRWRAIVLVGMCVLLAVALTGKLASENTAVSPAGSTGAVLTVKAGNSGDRSVLARHAHVSVKPAASAHISALAPHPLMPTTSSSTTANVGGQAIPRTTDRTTGKHLVRSTPKHAHAPKAPSSPGATTTQPSPTTPTATATGPAPSPPANSPSPGSTSTGPSAGEATTTTTPTTPTETTTTPARTPGGSGKSSEESTHGCALAAVC